MATYNDIINGLKLFASKQEDGEEEQLGGADHDIIFGPFDCKMALTDEDKAQLDKWGWFLDTTDYYWAHYV